jgi:predicted flap endonuclease-1-like 5' DNA nuclease
MFKLYKTMFTRLRDLQDRFWEESIKAFPGFELPHELNSWQLQTLENMSNWAESAVHHSLQLQREWLAQWSGRASGKKLKPKYFADLNAEARHTMQLWLDNQNELWNQWLEIVKASLGQNALPLLDEWSQSIQESVREQKALLRDWSKTVDFKKLSAKELAALSEQIGRSMQKSIEMQQQLWNQWFTASGITALSRHAGPKAPAAPKTKPRAKRPATAAKPTAATRRPAAAKAGLQQIAGIGPGLEKKLNDAGISTIDQIAKLTAKDIANLEQTLIGFSGRIEREQWVKQAKALVKAAGSP